MLVGKEQHLETLDWAIQAHTRTFTYTYACTSCAHTRRRFSCIDFSTCDSKTLLTTHIQTKQQTCKALPLKKNALTISFSPTRNFFFFLFLTKKKPKTNKSLTPSRVKGGIYRGRGCGGKTEKPIRKTYLICL